MEPEKLEETLTRDESAAPVIADPAEPPPKPYRKTITAKNILLVSAVILAAVIYRVVQYHAEEIVAVPKSDPVTICYSPEDNAAKAAAQYLAYALEYTIGANTEIVTTDAGTGSIRIQCGTEPPEPKQKATIEFIATAEAANADEKDTGRSVYSLLLEHDGVSILVPDREDCFGAVKAITDRWLQTDCGITGDGELVISRAMIGKQLTGLPTEVSGQIRILTQNLRWQDDGEGKSVEERADRFFQLVEKYQPDLIGTQENTWQWMQLLEENLSDRYELCGCSRLGPNTEDGEWNTILYRKDRFTAVGSDTFWLSNTPSEAASKLNYNGSVRICTWILLKDEETGKTLLFSNTHLQNTINNADMYQEVRERQAEILLQRLRGNGNMLSKYPGFLTGDFNGDSSEPFYNAITRVYNDAQTTAITDSSKVNYSFHDYGKFKWLIDFCFHSPRNTTILDYHILDDWYDGYISDHYGILVTALIN